jgi:hypothetical protein
MSVVRYRRDVYAFTVECLVLKPSPYTRSCMHIMEGGMFFLRVLVRETNLMLKPLLLLKPLLNCLAAN